MKDISRNDNLTFRRQANSPSVKSRTGQLTEMFDEKFGVYDNAV